MIALPVTAIFLFAACGLLVFAFGFWMGRQFPDRVNLGEALVVDAVASGFRRPHVLLNDVTLPIDGGTTQIDHVLVADTGIFVIETKHYTGWIFGDPREREWTQVIYKKKTRFPNPVRQNYGHVKALQSLFTLPEENFISLVVFSGDGEFKTELGPGVIRLEDLARELSVGRPVVVDERKMAYIVGRIEMKRLRRSIETEEYHINYVRRRLQARRLAKA